MTYKGRGVAVVLHHGLGGTPEIDAKITTAQSVECRQDTTTFPGSDPEPIPDEGWESFDCTPIVLDLAARGLRLTGLDRAVSFDLNADGVPDRLSWTDPDGGDGLLALDRNGNGRIDDGRELFSPVATQHDSDERNGFKALALFDEWPMGGNGDGMISTDDEIFERLLVWRDANHDGESQPDELTPLASHLTAIDLEVRETGRRDRFGNELRWSSKTLAEALPRPFGAVDVILLVP